MEWVNTMSAENNFITSVDVLFDRRVVYSDGFGNVTVFDPPQTSLQQRKKKQNTFTFYF